MNIDTKVSKGILAYIVSNTALGISEYYNLEMLYKISIVVSIIASFLFALTVFVYTYSYCKIKLCRNRSKKK